MAKKGQKGTWENDNFQNAKKTKVAKVTEMNPVGNGK